MRSMTVRLQKSASARTRQGTIVACVVAFATAVAGTAFAAVPPAPLSVDAAFATVASLEPGKIVVAFDVLPGHYLYRDRFEVQANGQVIAAISLPKGKIKTDPNFGRVEVYEQPFTLSAATKLTADTELKLVFQGCSEVAGVCYPPTTRMFALVAGAKAVPAKGAVPVSLKQQFKPQVSQ